MDYRIIHGDSREVLLTFDTDSIDACVTDPPYGLGFMGKEWDTPGIAHDPAFWREVFRVLKPGAHVVAFGGARTFHRLAVALEDAGFEIRDCVCWLFGSGFPKSTRVNRDPAFCQCASPVHSGANTDPLPPPVVRTGMGGAVSGGAPPHADGFRWTDAVSGSRADCQTERDSDGAQPRPVEDACQEESPSQRYALRHSHSDGLGDDLVDESKYSPCSAPHICRPSSPDYSPHARTMTDAMIGTSPNTVQSPRIDSGSETRGSDTQRNSESLSAFADCIICGKPDANGYGTALKPAWEPIILARKPLSESSVAKNVLRWGTGALNIDGCRIEVSDDAYARNASGDRGHSDNRTRAGEFLRATAGSANDSGRWPANLCLDEEAAAALDEQSGTLQAGASPAKRGLGSARCFGEANRAGADKEREQLDSGGASRFFYVAKPDVAERDQGTYHLTERTRNRVNAGGLENDPKWAPRKAGNPHPTVKPVSLMRWLVRMVTAPGATVLDPFLGSGTTMMAAIGEDRGCIGIEQDEHWCELAEARASSVAPLLVKVHIS